MPESAMADIENLDTIRERVKNHTIEIQPNQEILATDKPWLFKLQEQKASFF